MKALNLVCVLLASCATPTSGVVAQGDGYFTVTHQGSSFMARTDELRAAALKDAELSCSGRSLKVIHTKEIPAGPLGRWPEAEVVFRCE